MFLHIGLVLGYLRHYFIVQSFEIFIFSEVLEVAPELPDLFYGRLELQILNDPLEFDFHASNVSLEGLEFRCEGGFLFARLCYLVSEEILQVSSLLIVDIYVHLCGESL